MKPTSLSKKAPARGRSRIGTKRVYDQPLREDGFRVLVDRLWPRGLSKKKARVDLWLKEIAPSDALRRWFGHEPQKWPEFKKRYFAELSEHADIAGKIADEARKGPVTLVFGAKEARYNNAAALKEFIESKLLSKN
jgi:uncharacterized protein YeaO (DUF488 family)